MNEKHYFQSNKILNMYFSTFVSKSKLLYRKISCENYTIKQTNKIINFINK